MNKFSQALTCFILKSALWFRYRVKVEGLDKINAETLKNPGGVLFLPNHPAILVDPIIVALSVWKKYPVRPMIADYMFYKPGVHTLALALNALPVPNFSTSNSLKRKKNEKVFQEVINGLERGENFLIYPAGKTKDTEIEQLGGASGVHKIIQESKNINVVLVRVKGLWGSSFSRAFTPGSAPSLFPTLLRGIKHVFKNLLFFTPRREVTVSFEMAPADFPYKSSRLEMNRYLEEWYNRPDGLSKENKNAPGDTLVLVPYSMWSRELPKIPDLKAIDEDAISLNEIPLHIQNEIKQKLSEISDTDPQKIRPDMKLATEMGLDSLDLADLVTFLDDRYDVQGVVVDDLTTVNRLMGYASKILTTREVIEEHAEISDRWKFKGKRKRALIGKGDTIPDVFFDMADKLKNQSACGDDRLGILTYSQIKLRAILLAEYIRHLPGEHIGILLPSSATTVLLILAVQLAGKVPVMVNWTVGPRHLESVIALSKMEVVLSSWTFLDRLDNVEFAGLEDMLIMLEDLKPKFGLKEKLKAFTLSKRSKKKIFQHFGFDNNPERRAVLLFTSGTESMPKGVPLKHSNLLPNMRAGLEAIEIYNDDVLLAILPPFHSFGFTICSFFALLAGFKAAYYPNPVNGKGVASAFERWQTTVICGAPTFIKVMLKAAKPEQLKTMRLCITGAEKAPPDLFLSVEGLGGGRELIEGYGITECSPVLTINRLNRPHKGVGQPLDNVELIVVHPETLEILPPDTQGLILARGPNIFDGYINPDVSSPFVEVNGKQWYKTGDLGFLDENQALTISGRMKRFVKIGGEMISLASIENALTGLINQKRWNVADGEEGPALAVCAKELEGEKTRLYLFTRFSVTLDDINKALKESGFSNLVKMSEVKQLDAIPIMGTGKVNYRLLENQYLQENK